METLSTTQTDTNGTDSALDNTKTARSLQSRREANRVTRALEIISNAQTHPELAPALEERGFDATRFTHGRLLQATAQAAYNNRQQALSAWDEAAGKYSTAVADARRDFNHFRMTARSLFHDGAAVSALGLSGTSPQDLQTFIAAANAAYANALASNTYLTPLSENSYPQTRIEALHDALAQIIPLQNSRDAALTNAVLSTAQRRMAVKQLDSWLYRLRVAARPVTRNRPTLARLLE